VWFWNVNGLPPGDILSFLEREKPDVLALIDSQQTDKERFKQFFPGWKMIHESRPHNVHKRKQFGGITVMWQSDNVKIYRESGYPKGVISFIVQDAAGNLKRKPVAVVAL